MPVLKCLFRSREAGPLQEKDIKKPPRSEGVCSPLAGRPLKKPPVEVFREEPACRADGALAGFDSDIYRQLEKGKLICFPSLMQSVGELLHTLFKPVNWDLLVFCGIRRVCISGVQF